MQAIVDAKPESYTQEDVTRLKAIAILERYPELLFIEGRVRDHFGREILASPYQLFLGTGDIWAQKQVHETIIPKIGDRDEKAKLQFQKQFPNCPWPFTADMGEEVLYDDRNIKQIEEVIEQLKIIDAEISVDSCANGQATRDETTKAVVELCQIFTPKNGEVIKTGLHFPQAIMREIYKVYNAHIQEYNAQLHTWTDAQLSFYSFAVIGGALAASTAVAGQCYKNGIEILNMEKGPDRRDGLICRKPFGIPLVLCPIVGKLGREMFVDPYFGTSCFLSSVVGRVVICDKNSCRDYGGIGRGSCVGLFDFWKTFGKQKQRLMEAIMQPHIEKSKQSLPVPEQSIRCVIF